MKANGVCAHEHPEEKELQVLDPAARPRCERADRERYEAVTFSEQALHEGGHREYQRAGEPVPAAEGRVTTQPGVQRPRVPIWIAGRVGLGAGALDVVLVGGSHPDPPALERSGATWCIPEILPGATAAEALAVAATPPG